MNIYNGIDRLNEMNAACITIGNFDGLHLGHQKIINKMIRKADGNETIVITFQKAPAEILSPSKFNGYIFPPEYKMKFLEKMNVKNLVLLDFTKVAGIEAGDFIGMILGKISKPSLFVGYNFRFGKGNAGDIELLKAESKKNKFSLSIIERVNCNDRNENLIVSSSEIRDCISRGEMEKASAMLGRPYIYSSKIVQGDGIGHRLGFPTVNIAGNSQVLPQNGVYYTITNADGIFYPAMTYIGNRPTLANNELRIETNIIDYKGKISEKYFTIFFMQRIRKEIKFNNLEELQKNLYNDKETVLKIYRNYKITEKINNTWNIISGGK